MIYYTAFYSTILYFTIEYYFLYLMYCHKDNNKLLRVGEWETAGPLDTAGHWRTPSLLWAEYSLYVYHCVYYTVSH